MGEEVVFILASHNANLRFFAVVSARLPWVPETFHARFPVAVRLYSRPTADINPHARRRSLVPKVQHDPC